MRFAENAKSGVTYMTAPNIGAVHAFTARQGGVSRGAYASLNLGTNLGDDDSCVRENFALICGALGIGPGSLVRNIQVHGDCIRVVARKDRGSVFLPSQESDGLVTRETGVALIVFMADCVPILLHDPIQNAIGAVHAGWRGTALDIAGAAVRKMAEEFGCGPGNIKAAIGPSIQRCCYEIGPDAYGALSDTLGKAADQCLSPHGEKHHADLPEANRILLKNAGLTDITKSNECTSCTQDKYWSHRRDGTKRGSQAAIITL